MSHQDNVFNGKNFVENFEIWAEGTDPVVSTVDITSDTDAAKSAIDTNYTVTTTTTPPATPLDPFPQPVTTTSNPGVDAFFQQFNKDNKQFSSWTEFLNEITDDSADQAEVLAGFITSYRTILGMAPGDGDDPAGGDWAGIETVLANLQPPQSINVEEQFINSFEAFLFDYPFGSGAIANADEFFANWRRYMGVTAELGTTTNGVLGYRSVYDAFDFPAGEYNERLAKFFLDRQDVSEGGSSYFVPSHQFDEWFEEMRQEFIHRNFVSSVDTGTASELLVIDRILRLLISIIDILQRVSAVQANRLGFLTDWQTAYTDHLNEVPQFAEGDNPLGGDSTKTKNFRSEANARMQAITEKVRAWRSAVQDQAKAMQSTINQSQDAANQQTQMATSIIQQLSTILSQIFR